MSFLASDAPVLAFDAPAKSRFSPAQLGVFEWQDYFFQFPGAPFLRVGAREIAPLAPGLFRVKWENSLGLCRLQAGNEPEFWVEVLSPKFPSLQAHFELLRLLLDSLFERSRHLVWDFRGHSERGFESQNRALSPLETLEWALSHAGEIETIWSELLQRPRPRLCRQRQLVSAARVSGVDAIALREAVQNPARWENGLPRELQISRGIWRHDSPEMARAIQIGRAVSRELQNAQKAPYFGALDARFQEKTRRIIALFQSLEARFGALFPPGFPLKIARTRSEIGARLEILARSRVARGRPLWGLAERFAGVRDIATLWEFWAFFALVSRIENALQAPATLEARFDETRGLLAPSRALWPSFSPAFSLVFNGPAPSYSTPLRPDFLWFRGETATAAFDAKFRFDGENLHKMHAYCDALQIGAAVALHPSAKTTWFDRERGPQTVVPLRAILESSARGVGVWGVLPPSTS